MAGTVVDHPAAQDFPAVRVSKVVKAFGDQRSRVTVLDGLDLPVRVGEFVSVIGPSGCGKSTLLRIVAGLIPADSGEVTVHGEQVQEATREKLIGLVPQSPALLPWRTVLDNVRLPLRVNRKAHLGRDLPDPRQLLAEFGLADAVDRYPSQLSGGMQQRVAIARAFAFDPAILLMDEPFSSLDELTRDRQRLSLLDFWQSNRKSVLFVTHAVPEAIVLSDRIVVMAPRPGRIAAIVDVDLPRPRTQDSYATEEFRQLEATVRGHLQQATRSAA